MEILKHVTLKKTIMDTVFSVRIDPEIKEMLEYIVWEHNDHRPVYEELSRNSYIKKLIRDEYKRMRAKAEK